jgi:ABC-type sugar transport system permease subunit
MIEKGSRRMQTSQTSNVVAVTGKQKKPLKTRGNWKRMLALDAMLLPAVILTLIFAYIPMGGLVVAFQDFKPWLGFAKSEWVGLEHFQYFKQWYICRISSPGLFSAASCWTCCPATVWSIRRWAPCSA